MKVLRLSLLQEEPFVVVECGARETTVDRRLQAAFPLLRLIGFEPDADECRRLNDIHAGNHVFHPVAVGREAQEHKLYITDNPACSSLFKPNADFLGSFLEYPVSFYVQGGTELTTVALDTYLPAERVDHVDLLRLDVQGSELDVLMGGESFLRSSVLGAVVEVEFSPLYRDQPLFGDVDAYLRQFQFLLFDLSRVRYRRGALPHTLDSRGQLLWGDALYLRDYRYFVPRAMKREILKLAVLASVYGFHDYCAEIIQYLVDDTHGLLDDVERAELERARNDYYSDLRRLHPVARVARRLGRSRLQRALNYSMRRLTRVQQELAIGSRLASTHWSD